MISYILICISMRTCIIRVMSRKTETHMFVVTWDSVAHSHFVEVVTFINRCFRFIIFIGIGQRIPSISHIK
jgi:hypothetical protein